MSDELNPRYTLESYVVGGSTRQAVAAVRSVAANPGTAHNPLFIYSGIGLGKTHLLMAVGHAARAANPDLTVRYLTLGDLVAEHQDAVSSGQAEAFRDRFSGTDMLLLDDVQALGHQHDIQSEILRLAAQMQESGSQIVLTCDRPPAEIPGLDARLLAHFGGGLVIDLAPPGLETRLAILKYRAEERGVELSREVLEVIATGEVENVRELMGMLNRLIAFQAVSEHALTAEAARALVMGDGSPAARETPRRTGSDPVLIEVPPFAPENAFDFFLDGVTATVSEQVERMGGRLRDAIERWSAKGYRTGILEAALRAGDREDADAVLARYEESVAGLRALQHQMAECDPERSGDPVFSDPSQLVTATEMVRTAQNEFEPPPSPSETFSLETFLESEDTKMAVRAARSIADDPGTHYNPFVIVGGSGQGKTHLLHGIGRQLEETTGGMVACVPAQAFVDQLVHAIEENRIPTWRARYRQARALLIDNVDMLGERERVQEELFYLFNVMEEAGRQLIFTSNVPPAQIPGLDERLQSRMEGGLIVTLAPPNRALRKAVAHQQLIHRTGREDEQLSAFLADQPADSVRSVLGLGHRVLTAAEARGEFPSVRLAEQVLGGGAAFSAARKPGAVMVLPSGGIENPEKVVRDWPDPVDSIIEDFR